MPNKFLPPTTDTATRTAATPIDGEILYDTDEKKLYYGDGTTQGGKAIGSSTVSDSEFRIQDNSDLTKQIAFEASGITTGITRTLTSPDASGTIALIDTTGIADKDLFYYDASSKLFKRIAIGTSGQALLAEPSLNPPYQWATPTGGRELLTANRTYYVRTDGSDSNNGLANTAGGAFLTIQKAIDVAASLDWDIYNITIKINDGTYTISTPIVLKRGIGYGLLKIEGNTTNKTNVKIDGTGTTTVTIRPLSNVCNVIVDSLEFRNFQTGFSDWDLADYTNTTATEVSITLKDIAFYNMTSRAIYIASPSNLIMLRGTANRFEKLSANPTAFCTVLASDSIFDSNSATITMVNSPNFSSTYWLDVQRMAKANIVSLTISGSYVGNYIAMSGSMIYNNGATGINAGTTSGVAWILT